MGATEILVGIYKGQMMTSIAIVDQLLRVDCGVIAFLEQSDSLAMIVQVNVCEKGLILLTLRTLRIFASRYELH